jgi:hypothetical protein
MKALCPAMAPALVRCITRTGSNALRLRIVGGRLRFKKF